MSTDPNRQVFIYPHLTSLPPLPSVIHLDSSFPNANNKSGCYQLTTSDITLVFLSSQKCLWSGVSERIQHYILKTGINPWPWRWWSALISLLKCTHTCIERIACLTFAIIKLCTRRVKHHSFRPQFRRCISWNQELLIILPRRFLQINFRCHSFWFRLIDCYRKGVYTLVWGKCYGCRACVD